MNRYIDADELKKSFQNTEDAEYCRWTLAGVLGEIDDMPTADVAEVKHGSWEHIGNDEWCCTACGHIITTEGSWERPWQKYCEECGASMMDEVEE